MKSGANTVHQETPWAGSAQVPSSFLRTSRTEKTRKQVANVHTSNTVRPSQDRNSFSWKNIYCSEVSVEDDVFDPSAGGGGVGAKVILT